MTILGATTETSHEPDSIPATSRLAPSTSSPVALTGCASPILPTAPPGKPSLPGGTNVLSSPNLQASLPAAHLRIYADTLDDFEGTRVAMSNRLGALAREGLGNSPEHARLSGVLDALGALEHGVELELKRALRKHPLGPWVKATIGVGEKQGARLIAAIGDPAWNDLHDRPRTLGELWAYCGYHTLPAGDHDSLVPHDSAVPRTAAARQRGHTANWNSDAKMRAWLVAGSCIKRRESPYRVTYDLTRAKYAESVHAVPCRRCGPAGHPAPVGSPLSAGHQHARALRAVAKEILRALWTEARRTSLGVDDAPT